MNRKLPVYLIALSVAILLALLLFGGRSEGEPPAEAPIQSTGPSSDPSPVPSEEPDLSDAPVEGYRPVEREGKYVYNPGLLSEECIEARGTEFADFYREFITSYLAYEDSCPCGSESFSYELVPVLNNECAFCSSKDFASWNWSPDEKRLYWSYNVTQEELQSRIDAVAAELQRFLDLVRVSDDEADKMQAVYSAFCPVMDYDYAGQSSRENIEACYVFINHTGICTSFTTAINQILAQMGIFSTEAAGNTNGGESHAWNYVRINGQYYFFDTTYEIGTQDGIGFGYYGMRMTEREESGIERQNLWIGRYTSFEPDIPDTRLFIK